MELGSIKDAIEAVRNQMFDVDFDVMSGAEASGLVSLLSPFKNQLDGFVLAASARALFANQHNVDGARSGASWVAEKIGISETQARGELALNRQLNELPDVAKAVRSGSLSLAKASAIGRGAQGNEAVASSLLDVAIYGTVEMIDLRAREIHSASFDETQRERLRRSQFVQVSVDSNSMVSGSFRLLPKHAVGILEAHRKSKGSNGYEQAESFARLLRESGSKKTTEVVFHLDIELGSTGVPSIGSNASLKGIGPVPVQSVIEVFEEASFKLVGTSNNKLVGFSEKTRRSSCAPIPEYVKGYQGKGI